MKWQMFVDGAWIPARSGATTVATSQATGEDLGTVPEADPAGGPARTAAWAGSAAPTRWTRSPNCRR